MRQPDDGTHRVDAATQPPRQHALRRSSRALQGPNIRTRAAPPLQPEGKHNGCSVSKLIRRAEGVDRAVDRRDQTSATVLLEERSHVVLALIPRHRPDIRERDASRDEEPSGGDHDGDRWQTDVAQRRSELGTSTRRLMNAQGEPVQLRRQLGRRPGIHPAEDTNTIVRDAPLGAACRLDEPRIRERAFGARRSPIGDAARAATGVSGAGMCTVCEDLAPRCLIPLETDVRRRWRGTLSLRRPVRSIGGRWGCGRYRSSVRRSRSGRAARLHRPVRAGPICHRCCAARVRGT